MKSLTRIACLAAVPFLLVTFGGCSDDEAAPNAPGDFETAEGIDLNAPFGGFTMTDEDPAFGDVDLAESVDDEVEIDDVITDSPEFDVLLDDPAAKIYPTTITWGVLLENELGQNEENPSDGPVTDWTGSLEVSRGAILLLRAISFDRGDEVVLPRTDIRRVEWISHTAGHLDGLRLQIYIPPSDDPNAGPDTLRFESAAYSRTFLIPQDLIDLDEIIEVGGEGNEIRFQAYEARRSYILSGFLAGSWGPIEEDGVGRFIGRWVDRSGVVSGFLRGIYGFNDDGERVIFGKFIKRTGRFDAFLRGTWAEMPIDGLQRGRTGVFLGDIINPDADGQILRVGGIDGRWKSEEDQPGYLDGRWCLGCN